PMCLWAEPCASSRARSFRRGRAMTTMWSGSTSVRPSCAPRQRTMAEIINFKRAQKARARRAKDEKADQNRIEFGTPKAEKARTKTEREKDSRKIDSHKLDEND